MNLIKRIIYFFSLNWVLDLVDKYFTSGWSVRKKLTVQFFTLVVGLLILKFVFFIGFN
ncbi:hypothetical protein PTC81_06935 [Yersinia pestis]|nr:hypothetical protein [Yersinia pestis]MDL0976482.1 hypothetical protein [Yersinia pestis]MDL0984330.1 hypothetical protein [Yersinia pestis]MDL1004129.1 hypothetical protein [Yersinia pestis]MDL1067271.1 hypothetical protein [Yersinia pestis]